MIDTKIYGQNTKQNIIKHLMMEFRNITVWSCYSISFDRIVMLPRISNHMEPNFYKSVPKKKTAEKNLHQFLSTIHFSVGNPWPLPWFVFELTEEARLRNPTNRRLQFASGGLFLEKCSENFLVIEHLGIEQMDFV